MGGIGESGPGNVDALPLHISRARPVTCWHPFSRAVQRTHAEGCNLELSASNDSRRTIPPQSVRIACAIVCVPPRDQYVGGVRPLAKSHACGDGIANSHK